MVRWAQIEIMLKKKKVLIHCMIPTNQPVACCCTQDCVGNEAPGSLPVHRVWFGKQIIQWFFPTHPMFFLEDMMHCLALFTSIFPRDMGSVPWIAPVGNLFVVVFYLLSGIDLLLCDLVFFLFVASAFPRPFHFLKSKNKKIYELEEYLASFFSCDAVSVDGKHRSRVMLRNFWYHATFFVALLCGEVTKHFFCSPLCRVSFKGTASFFEKSA